MAQQEKEIVQELSDAILDEYSRKQITQAFIAVELEKKGKGCGCDNCIMHKVRELNNWIDWLIEDPDKALLYKCSVVRGRNGKLRILSGLELENERTK